MAAISEIRMNKRIAVAQSTNGSLVLALPVDYLIWTQGVDRRSQELVGANRASGFTGKVDLSAPDWTG